MRRRLVGGGTHAQSSGLVRVCGASWGRMHAQRASWEGRMRRGLVRGARIGRAVL